jgi:NADPH:quinone reductase-like Zn-dependent oxidoreductase
MFRALVVDNNGGTVTASMQTVNEASLPAGNVLVEVECSTVRGRVVIDVNSKMSA